MGLLLLLLRSSCCCNNNKKQPQRKGASCVSQLLLHFVDTRPAADPKTD
jgi:hypothetical protein